MSISSCLSRLWEPRVKEFQVPVRRPVYEEVSAGTLPGTSTDVVLKTPSREADGSIRLEDGVETLRVNLPTPMDCVRTGAVAGIALATGLSLALAGTVAVPLGPIALVTAAVVTGIGLLSNGHHDLSVGYREAPIETPHLNGFEVETKRHGVSKLEGGLLGLVLGGPLGALIGLGLSGERTTVSMKPKVEAEKVGSWQQPVILDHGVQVTKARFPSSLFALDATLAEA